MMQIRLNVSHYRRMVWLACGIASACTLPDVLVKPVDEADEVESDEIWRGAEPWNGNIGRLLVAMAGPGNSAAVWDDATADGPAIRASVREITQDWSPPVALTLEGHTPSGVSGLAWDDKTAIALIEGQPNDDSQRSDVDRFVNSEARSIFAATLDRAGSWGTPKLIDVGLQQPLLAVDVSGNAIIVGTRTIVEGATFGWTLNVALKEAGKDWGASTPVVRSPMDATGSLRRDQPVHTAAAVNYHGSALIVWSDVIGDLWVVDIGTGSSGSPQKLESATPGSSGSFAVSPQLVLDFSGEAHLIWTRLDRDRTTVRWSRFQKEVGWSAPVILDEGGAGSGTAVMSLKSPPFAVWPHREAAKNALVVSFFVPIEGAWTPPEPFEVLSESNTASTPAMAMDRTGHALVAWTVLDESGEGRVRARRYFGGAGWGSLAEISAGAARADALSVAVVGDQGMVLWREEEKSGRKVFWTNRFE